MKFTTGIALTVCVFSANVNGQVISTRILPSGVPSISDTLSHHPLSTLSSVASSGTVTGPGVTIQTSTPSLPLSTVSVSSTAAGSSTAIPSSTITNSTTAISSTAIPTSSISSTSITPSPTSATGTTSAPASTSSGAAMVMNVDSSLLLGAVAGVMAALL